MQPIDVADGAVLHGIKHSSPGFAGFGEAYFSEVAQGVIKRWRRHREATTNLVVPHGTIRVVVHDDRTGTDTGDSFAEFRLGRDPVDFARLTIAPGLWFAFQGVAEGTNLLFNLSDHEHDPAEAESRTLAEIPFAW
jgi:dTDP-4-dehydrorhamnose 3,5-epimerase